MRSKYEEIIMNILIYTRISNQYKVEIIYRKQMSFNKNCVIIVNTFNEI